MPTARPGKARSTRLDYACTLRLHPTAPTWFWTVEVTNRTGRRLSVDAVLAQDLGLAGEDVVRSSEAYTSQYIDHTVLRAGDLGIVLCSRQNTAQAGIRALGHARLPGRGGRLPDRRGPAVRARVPGDERAGGASCARRCRTASTSTSSRSPPSGPAPSRCPVGATGRITFFAAFEADHPAATGPSDVAGALRAAEAFTSLPPLGAPRRATASTAARRGLRRAGHVREPGPRHRRARALVRPGMATRGAARRRAAVFLPRLPAARGAAGEGAGLRAADRPRHALRAGAPPERRDAVRHRLDVRAVRVPGRHRQHGLQQAAGRVAAPAQRAEVQRPARLRADRSWV